MFFAEWYCKRLLSQRAHAFSTRRGLRTKYKQPYLTQSEVTYVLILTDLDGNVISAI